MSWETFLGGIVVALAAGAALAALWFRGRTSSRLPEPSSGPPVAETLARLELQIRELEAQRQHMMGGIEHQLDALSKETVALSQAMRQPQGRGRWGELTLRRVAELSGMVAYCDFFEQASSDGQRPDMIVRLAGGRTLAVDAKVPFAAYLEAETARGRSSRGGACPPRAAARTPRRAIGSSRILGPVSARARNGDFVSGGRSFPERGVGARSRVIGALPDAQSADCYTHDVHQHLERSRVRMAAGKTRGKRGNHPPHRVGVLRSPAGLRGNLRRGWTPSGEGYGCLQPFGGLVGRTGSSRLAPLDGNGTWRRGRSSGDCARGRRRAGASCGVHRRSAINKRSG